MATASEARPVARPRERRAHALLVLVLLSSAALAWWASAAQMAGMSGAPGARLGPLGVFLVVWLAMMAAMMLPSLAPMVLAHARVSATRATAVRGTTAAFVLGYFIAWTAYGLVAYGAWAAGRTALGGLSWEDGGRLLSAGALAAAAAYQVLPAKRACLTRCRSPFAFLTEEWRDGRDGALRMGVGHGAWCVGCCWALMVALFALGVMSLVWMALVTALITAEKLLPRGRATSVAVAAVLVLLALGVAVAPEAVPGFAEPPAEPMVMH